MLQVDRCPMRNRRAEPNPRQARNQGMATNQMDETTIGYAEDENFRESKAMPPNDASKEVLILSPEIMIDIC